ncbi:MAG: class I SAM-dependent methyltransferase family protein [Candidatus Thermoplasmatota archaeon]|nr:class I SAM-dependent methyltransferase family protein [Candidatus Thermoplasmatota archaeon]
MSDEDHPVLRVSKEKGQETLQELKDRGNLDPERSIRSEGDELLFPVKEGGNCSETEPEFREENINPYERIKYKIGLPESKKRSLPDKWEKIGDVLLIKLPDELMEHKEQIGEVYADVLDAKTVMLQGSIKGQKREPEVKKIYGDETETVHIENDILYKLDTAELMFSSGNIDERIRMAEEVEKDEVIVDMFAGIGYFSLPMAVHGEPEKVFSLEINPTAFHYLRENVALNHVEDIVKPWHGDNRDFSLKGADRVVMGYLHETWKYLDKAGEFLDGEGIIHYHTRCSDSGYPDQVISEIEKNLNPDFDLLGIKNVKSYAPHVFHVVVDLELHG